MQVTYGELLSYRDPILEMMKLEVPANIGVRIAKLARSILDELQPALDQRNKLIQRYGKEVDGKMIVLETSENWGAYMKEIEALSAEKTTIKAKKIKIPADTKIGVGILLALDKFIGVEGE